MVSAPLQNQGIDAQPSEEENYEMGPVQNRSSNTAAPDNNQTREIRATRPDQVSRKSWNALIAAPRVDVPLSSARDHLANERVFLAYFRTSSALATFAVVLLQLYRLKHDPPAPGVLSDYNIGIPLASTILAMAMLVTVFGAVRFFRCQKSMISSSIVGSGNVVSMFSMVMIMLFFVLFVLTIIVNPDA
ncbi:hypothetical protein LTR84_006617 [Exophiala bonariae]|uniref:DUF202 domain-containing protein n=1 Tax=Exophiala bonariae TaxID=1690606 RepID=A0AAV9N4D8_9EURO|nr:hypothetical protein LTR84_006617 [Exophiala bonariae]